MKTLLEIWRVLSPLQRRQLLILQFVSLMMAFSTLCGIAAVLPFFAVLGDTLTGGHTEAIVWLRGHVDFGTEHAFVIALGLAFVGLVVVANAINLAGSLLMTRFAFSVGNDLQVAVFDEYLHRDCRFHADHNSATLATRVIHDAGRVTTGLLHGGFSLSTGLITSILIVGSLIALDPLVASLAVAVFGIGYLSIYATTRSRLLRNGEIESIYAAKRTKTVNEALGSIREVILLDTQPHFIERFRSSCGALAQTLTSTLAISQSPKYLLESLAVAALTGLAIFESDHAAGGAWLPQLTFIGFAAYRLLPALHQVYAASVKITADAAAFRGIAGELRRVRARAQASEPPQAQLSGLIRPRNEIVLESVCFRYAPDQPYAIHDLSLRIPVGTTIGLVGANGAGKSTLVDLIAGLLLPESGHISVDGVVIDMHNRRSWRTNIAYVLQSVFILDASLAENVALGVPAAAINREAVRHATHLAQLDDCVKRLPNGHDEVLGERGVRLSGGLRQRVGLARALYRDAAVLILDEATSALDAKTELETIDMLARFRHQRTVLVITHEESLLRRCDMVVELDHGRIVRSGEPAQFAMRAG